MSILLSQFVNLTECCRLGTDVPASTGTLNTCFSEVLAPTYIPNYMVWHIWNTLISARSKFPLVIGHTEYVFGRGIYDAITVLDHTEPKERVVDEIFVCLFVFISNQN
jgi:hypothetical protein